jgi:hypothetical protein
MQSNGIFAKRLARRLEPHELDAVGGAINVAGTFRANTCAVGGGWDGDIVVDGPIYN